MGRAGPAAQFWLMDKMHTRPSQSDMLVPLSESPTGTLLPSRRMRLARSKNQTWAWAGWDARVCRQIHGEVSQRPLGWKGQEKGFIPSSGSLVWEVVYS